MWGRIVSCARGYNPRPSQVENLDRVGQAILSPASLSTTTIASKIPMQPRPLGRGASSAMSDDASGLRVYPGQVVPIKVTIRHLTKCSNVQRTNAQSIEAARQSPEWFLRVRRPPPLTPYPRPCPAQAAPLRRRVLNVRCLVCNALRRSCPLPARPQLR